MNDLIARLERAESGSRELDAEIWRAADPKKYERVALSQSGLYPRGFNPEMKAQWLVQRMASKAPSYTTSLDAALSLVPDDFEIGIAWAVGDRHAVTAIGRNAIAGFAKGEGEAKSLNRNHAMALALCIAALKARG